MVEGFNLTLQVEWVYRGRFVTNAERTAALSAWLMSYNYQRRALGGRQPTATHLVAEYH